MIQITLTLDEARRLHVLFSECLAHEALDEEATANAWRKLNNQLAEQIAKAD